ncbi:MAG: GNAT family N-acetyltransferase [Crocinitomicaceae bacterium]
MQIFTNYQFEKAFPAEMETLADLAAQIWPDTFSSILTEDQIAYMLNWMYAPAQLRSQLSEGHDFYFLRTNGTEIGFVGLEKNYPEKGMLRIHKIYLLPQFQGKNLGKFMLEETEKIARMENLHSLHLNVNRFNKAKDFYLKMGFVVVKEEDIAIGNGYLMEDYVMSKTLN